MTEEYTRRQPRTMTYSKAELEQRARMLVEQDLFLIDQYAQSGTAFDYSAIIGSHFDAKIAAFIFLAQVSLVETERDMKRNQTNAKRSQQITLIVRALYYLQAVEAFVILYRFVHQRLEKTGNPGWDRINNRLLTLLTQMPEQRQRVIAGIRHDPIFLTRLQGMVKDGQSSCVQLLEDIKKVGNQPIPLDDPLYLSLHSPYASCIQRVDEDVDEITGDQIDSIEKAVRRGDFIELMRWIREGTLTTMREVLKQAAEVMAVERLIEFLHRLAGMPELSAERLIIVVQELGIRNRLLAGEGGHSEVNRTLAHIAMTPDHSKLTPAREAISELVSVSALKHLMAIVEHTAQLEIAETAIAGLQQLRKLQLVKDLVNTRPDLKPLYQRAYDQLQRLQEIKFDVMSCVNEETVQIYLEELYAASAVPELQELSKQPGRMGELALKILFKIDPIFAADYYS